MLNTDKFDIISASETWTKDNHHQLDYQMKIPNYIPIFKNCSDKNGNGIGFHIKLMKYAMTLYKTTKPRKFCLLKHINTTYHITANLPHARKVQLCPINFHRQMVSSNYFLKLQRNGKALFFQHVIQIQTLLVSQKNLRNKTETFSTLSTCSNM